MSEFDTLVKGMRGVTQEAVSEAVDYACVEMMRKTEPFGTGKKVLDKFEDAIENQIKRVVVGVDDRFAEFLGGLHGVGSRRAMDETVSWNAKDGSLREWKIDRLALDAGQQEIQAWHKRQRDRRGRVPWRSRQEKMVVSARAAEIYIKRKKELAGMAKAGWVGRLRVIRFAPPAWIRRHAMRVNVVRRGSGQGGGYVEEARNPVPWVSALVRRSGFSRGLKGAMNQGNYVKWGAKVRRKMEGLAKEFNR